MVVVAVVVVASSGGSGGETVVGEWQWKSSGDSGSSE
jgi:hypothetical protein